MAYKNYLFKFGDFTFPMKYIADEGYECAPHQRQSLDSYTDENGLTHDNALPHSKTDVKIKTLPMPGKAFDSIMSNFSKNFISSDARDAQCTYYDTEKGTYSIGHMYFDKSFNTKLKTIRNGELIYASMDWEFIEY